MAAVLGAATVKVVPERATLQQWFCPVALVAMTELPRTMSQVSPVPGLSVPVTGKLLLAPWGTVGLAAAQGRAAKLRIKPHSRLKSLDTSKTT